MTSHTTITIERKPRYTILKLAIWLVALSACVGCWWLAANLCARLGDWLAVTFT